MTLSTLTSRYSLLIGLAALILFFTIKRPDIFPTLANAGSIMSDNAVLTLVALGIMVPLIVGQFDLSPGFVASLAVMMTAGFLSDYQLHPVLVLLIVLGVGAAIGATMGVLVGYLQLNSLIVSLGVGSVVAGLVLLYSGGQIIFKGIPSGFVSIGQTRLFDFIPMPFLYALLISAVMWFVLTQRPAGRRLYAVGANPEAATLIGINVPRAILIAFVCSSMMASLAGFIQVSRLGAGHPTSAQAFLLPAFAAAFLGPPRSGPVSTMSGALSWRSISWAPAPPASSCSARRAMCSPCSTVVVLVIAVVAARLGVLRRNRAEVAAARKRIPDNASGPKPERDQAAELQST